MKDYLMWTAGLIAALVVAIIVGKRLLSWLGRKSAAQLASNSALGQSNPLKAGERAEHRTTTASSYVKGRTQAPAQGAEMPRATGREWDATKPFKGAYGKEVPRSDDTH